MASRMLRSLYFVRSSFRVVLFGLAGALACLLLAVAPAAARSKPKTKVLPPPPLLPATFSAWQQVGAPHTSSSPNVADPGSAAVLQECGFQRFESAAYTRDDGKLNIRAMQFGDASGAFSAFTFYRRPNTLPEKIGTGAAFDGKHVLFWTGATLVDATFDHLTSMSASELRDLAQQLPKPTGGDAILPTVYGYLPPQHLNRSSLRYALGPQTYTQGGGVLPSSLVDFGRGAETATAQYSSADGTGVITVIEYPTPQIAMDRENAVQNYLKAGNSAQSSWSQSLVGSNPLALQVQRSGPVLAVSSGSFSATEARNLLGHLHYEADVTWNNPKGYISDASKLGRLVVGIFILFGILGGTSIILGLFFGGGRALIRRLQGKPASAMNETMEFIRLNLRD